MKSIIIAGLLLTTSILFAEMPAALSEFFAVETFKEVPPEVEVLSEEVKDGIRITSLKFNGGTINGQKTRIFAHYTRPDKADNLPAVLNIHGAGLKVLKPNFNYPQNGFACLSIDWAGPAKSRKVPRKPPYSEFESNGNMADSRSGKWEIAGVDNDGIRFGVIFARRGLEFLRNRPEVDKDNIFTVGASAGAHLSLILLGLESGVKASVVKYGTGFIRDIPGFYGGYFGPVSLCPKDQQDQWLKYFDPKQVIKNYKTRVLLLSGTDDIFFWMPVVFKTYREIPTEKRLLMRPNDNHRLVGNENISVNFFKEAMSGSLSGWPLLEAPVLSDDGGRQMLSAKVISEKQLKSVSLVYKVMPLPFQFKGTKEYHWQIIPMTAGDNGWEVEMPVFDKKTDQMVAYVNAEDVEGGIASSDTIEYPAWPRWRGLPGKDRAPTLSSKGNLLGEHGTFEQKKGFNFTGKSTVDLSGDNARTGRGAALLHDGDKNLIARGLPGTEGKKFILKGWFKSVDAEGGSARVQINWNKSQPFKFNIITPKISNEYQELKIEGTIPAGATGGLLIMTSPGNGMYVDDLDYRVIE